MKVKSGYRPWIVAVLILTATSCTDGLFSDQTTSATVNEATTTDGNETLVTFSIDQASASARTSEYKDVVAPNELVWVDIGDELPIYHHQPLVDGENDVALPKDGIHIVGFVYNPSLSRTGVAGRSIVGPLQTIGNLSIITYGLDSIPLSADAGEGIALGQLSTGEDTLSSSATDIAADLGYDEEALSSFGVFDSSLTKLMNPDVDANGIYDSEENRRWWLTTLRYFSFNAGDVAPDGSLNVSADEIIAASGRFKLVFWLDASFPHPDIANVNLTLPPEIAYIDNGTRIYSIAPNHSNENPEGPGGIFNQYYFEVSDIDTPTAPYKGDYILDITSSGETSHYYFNNLDFLGTSTESRESILMPISSYHFEGGYLKTVSWEWKKIVDDTIVPASEDEVKLIVRQFYFYFGQNLGTQMPDTFGVPYYINGTLDVSSYNLEEDSYSYIECDYWDRAANDCKFFFDL